MKEIIPKTILPPSRAKMLRPKSSAKTFETKIRSTINQLHEICNTSETLYLFLDDINYLSKQITRLIEFYKTEIGEK